MVAKYFWSIPVSVGRRGREVPVSSPAEQELPHRSPPTPAPSEDRYFTDWSSIGMRSPLVRMPCQSVLVRERGQDINQPATQTTQPGSEPAQIRVTENALQSVTYKRGMIYMRTNTTDVEVRPHRDREPQLWMLMPKLLYQLLM